MVWEDWGWGSNSLAAHRQGMLGVMLGMPGVRQWTVNTYAPNEGDDRKGLTGHHPRRGN